MRTIIGDSDGNRTIASVFSTRIDLQGLLRARQRQGLRVAALIAVSVDPEAVDLAAFDRANGPDRQLALMTAAPRLIAAWSVPIS
jgi:hypothetical protein